MTHTNVTIPDPYSYRETLELRCATLTAERDHWKKRAEWAAAELENIPAAIEKYGYVDFPNGLTLIANPANQKDHTKDEQ